MRETSETIASDLNHHMYKILFPAEPIEQSEFLLKHVGTGDIKITGLRKKQKITDNREAEKEVGFLVSKAEINRENAYIAFVQLEKADLVFFSF